MEFLPPWAWLIVGLVLGVNIGVWMILADEHLKDHREHADNS